MGLLTIDWFDPTLDTGDPPGAGETGLWVFGIVIDGRSLTSRRFVRRPDHPRRRRIEEETDLVDGVATAGVVAVLCDWSGCGGTGEWAAFGSVAASALDRLLDHRLRDRAATGNPRDLQLWVEQDITDTVRRGWNGLGPLADRHLATAQRLLTIDGPVDERLDLRFVTPGSDLRLTGTLRHSPDVDEAGPSIPADPQVVGSTR